MDESVKSHIPFPDSKDAESLELNKVRPTPKRYLFGRPVYTEEQLAEMDPLLPPEPHYIAEWERRQALKAKQ